MIKIIKLFLFPVLFSGLFFMASCGQYFSNNSELSGSEEKIQPENQITLYVLGSEDIPLFNGLELLDEDSTSFDTMSGNIVISSYFGELNLGQVANFYSQTLPQLGWELIKDSGDKITYKRDSDKLEISLNQKDEKLNVRFFISSSLK
jgi:hypothetical protein